MEKYNELKDMILSIETDISKFYEKGNGAAGTRARMALQKIKRKAHEIRKDISENKIINGIR